MTIDFVSCQTFAGGFDVGATQAGLRMVHKVEAKGGFGMRNCLENRGVLGEQWTHQAVAPEEWEPIDVPLVIANPPCSGFSLLSPKDFRGSDSPVNSCMWDLEAYAAKIRPMMVVMESVQQAHKIGLDLMRDLRAKLEWDTGDRYDLYHVLHNNASVGGCSIRKRYFMVLSRVPFGVEREVITRMPVLDDVIGDLEGLGSTWEAQPYARPANWWMNKTKQRSESGVVDGHSWRVTPYAKRALDLLPEAGPWEPKETISTVARRYYQREGQLPDSWKDTEAKLVAKDFMMGYNQLMRWHGQKVARVITGGGCDLSLHPHEDRLFTHREVARIMGFPDDWKILPLRGTPGLNMTWGKGVSVPCGKWIGTWAKNSLEGRPGSYTGDPGSQDREYLIDVTNDYRAVCDER